MQIVKKEVKKILVIKFKGIGDIILMQPALRALKESYKGAEISVLINKESYDVLSGLKFIDNIIIFDKKKERGIKGDLGLINRIKNMKFDMVIDLYCNMRSSLLALLSGAKYRVGFTYRVRKHFYNIKIEGAKDILYGVDVYLRLMNMIGAHTRNKATEIAIPKTAQKYADKFINEEGIRKNEAIGFNPFGGFKTKLWPRQNFIKLGKKLAAKNKKIIVIWGPGEQKEAERVVKGIGRNALLAPKTDLKQLAGLLKRMRLLVGNDAGAKHIAVAVKTNTVTLFGPTNPKAWTPWGDRRHVVVQAGTRCQPCEKTTCKKWKCMKRISVEKVYSVMSKSL